MKDHSVEEVDLLVVGGGKAGKLLAMDRARGMWKAVVDADTDRILGVALLGHASGEVVAAVQMAMLAGLTYQQVRDAVITHPPMGEGLNVLFDAVAG